MQLLELNYEYLNPKRECQLYIIVTLEAHPMLYAYK